MNERKELLWIWTLIVIVVLFILWLAWQEPAQAQSSAGGEPNWSADIFGDRDGAIELYRDNVNFHNILAEEISEYNIMRAYNFPDEAYFKQVTTPAEADVIVHDYIAEKPGCWGYAKVWIGAPDEVGIAKGCWDYYHAGYSQPLRGTILHEVMGHLNGLYHQMSCTAAPNQQTVMEVGATGAGCSITLQRLGPRDVATLREPG